MQKNIGIREKIKEGSLCHWQVAKEIGVSEGTFCKWLRCELPPEKEARILDAIAKLRKEEE